LQRHLVQGESPFIKQKGGAISFILFFIFGATRDLDIIEEGFFENSIIGPYRHFPILLYEKFVRLREHFFCILIDLIELLIFIIITKEEMSVSAYVVA